MKTNQKRNKKSGIKGLFKRSDKKQSNPLKLNDKDELVVIRDASNGKEYYLSIVDTFVLSKREYIVMYNYVPDDGNHESPELVIMRTEYASNGNQLFYSIKDPVELELAFTCFMRRYYSSATPDKQAKSGVNYANVGAL